MPATDDPTPADRTGASDHWHRAAVAPVVGSASRGISELLVRYPHVAKADGALLKRFLEYATETVDYADEGTPDLALTFASLGHFFEDADVLVALPSDQQAELVDEIRPPARRHVTWGDFRTILQIVADFRFPELDDDVGMRIVVDEALQSLKRMDEATRRHGLGLSAATAPRTRVKAAGGSGAVDIAAANSRDLVSSPQQPTLPSTGLLDGAAVESSVPTAPGDDSASHLKARREGQHDRLPTRRQIAESNVAMRHHGGVGLSTSAPTSSRQVCSVSSSNRPAALSTLAADIEVAITRKWHPSTSFRSQSPHEATASFCATFVREWVDALLCVAPLPISVRNRTVTVEDASVVGAAIQPKLQSVVCGAVPLDVCSGSPSVNVDVLWAAVTELGRLLFAPSNFESAQEELALQVLLHSMEVLIGDNQAK